MPPGSTSREAYNQHVVKGKACTQRDRILLALKKFGPMSRSQLADLFADHSYALELPELEGPQIPLASVCGRVNALIASGQVRVINVRTDKHTGARVEFLEAVEQAPTQRRFEGAFR